MTVGVPDIVAEAWWFECDARPHTAVGHFTDKGGKPIVRWQSHLTSYGCKWRANESRRASSHDRANPRLRHTPAHRLVSRTPLTLPRWPQAVGTHRREDRGKL
jgi:hypothetical protein